MQCVSLCWRTCRSSGARTLARRLSLSRKLSSRLRTSKSDLTPAFFAHVAYDTHILTYRAVHMFSQRDIMLCDASRYISFKPPSKRLFTFRPWTAADTRTDEILVIIPQHVKIDRKSFPFATVDCSAYYYRSDTEMCLRGYSINHSMPMLLPAAAVIASRDQWESFVFLPPMLVFLHYIAICWGLCHSCTCH